jgi:hypothetical protein
VAGARKGGRLNPSREFARQLFTQGIGCKAIATLMRLPKGTVKWWRFRHRWRRTQPPPTQETQPPLLWCSSIYHDSAHLVNTVTLLPVCGAKLLKFASWTIQTDPLRKCQRCMPHEKRA